MSRLGDFLLWFMHVFHLTKFTTCKFCLAKESSDISGCEIPLSKSKIVYLSQTFEKYTS